MNLFGPRRREEAPWWVTGIYQRLDLILSNQESLMADMNELRAATARNTDARTSILTVLQGISQQLKDAQAQNDPQAIQDVVNQLDQNTNALASAAVQGTKADPNPATAQAAPQPQPDASAGSQPVGSPPASGA